MKREWNDQELKDAFQDLRARDERSAPPFAGVHDAALARSWRARLWRPAAAAAAVLIVTASAFALRGREARPPAASLSDWRSPTEFLLTSPGGYLTINAPILPIRPGELQLRGVHHFAPRDS